MEQGRGDKLSFEPEESMVEAWPPVMGEPVAMGELEFMADLLVLFFLKKELYLLVTFTG